VPIHEVDAADLGRAVVPFRHDDAREIFEENRRRDAVRNSRGGVKSGQEAPRHRFPLESRASRLLCDLPLPTSIVSFGLDARMLRREIGRAHV
jgi:hypothetical protein